MGVHRGGRGRRTTASLVAFIVEHVVVVHVHQDGDGLADDQGYPDGRVPIVTPEEFGDEPGQRDLEGMERVRGSSISPTAKRGSTSGACRTTPPPPPNSCPPSQGTQHESGLSLTCAAIPMNAQGRNIFRGTLNKYCGDTASAPAPDWEQSELQAGTWGG